MPFWMLILLIVGLSIAIFLVQRPLQVLTQSQWIISHLFLWIGLWLIMGYILLTNIENIEQVSMVVGGIWTLAGGVCFVVAYIIRQMKTGSPPAV